MDEVKKSLLDVDELCQRYGPMVLRRCRQLLHNEEDAMDACQDVFVRLLEQRAHLNALYPSSLLYRIATNVCLNRIRDGLRRPVIADDELILKIASAENLGASNEARMILSRLFHRHPESSSTIAVLHYVDGLTLEQVAEVVGLSVSGVRKRLRSLRNILKKMES